MIKETQVYLLVLVLILFSNVSAFMSQAVFMTIAAFTMTPGAAISCLSFAVGLGGFAWAGFAVNHLDLAPQVHTLLHTYMPHSTGTNLTPPVHTYLTPQVHTSLHMYIPHSTGTCLILQVHTSLHRYIPHSTGTNLTPQVHASLHRYIPHSTGTYLTPQCELFQYASVFL